VQGVPHVELQADPSAAELLGRVRVFPWFGPALSECLAKATAGHNSVNERVAMILKQKVAYLMFLRTYTRPRHLKERWAAVPKNTTVRASSKSVQDLMMLRSKVLNACVVFAILLT
jgi:hypothetical protein